MCIVHSCILISFLSLLHSSCICINLTQLSCSALKGGRDVGELTNITIFLSHQWILTVALIINFNCHSAYKSSQWKNLFQTRSEITLVRLSTFTSEFFRLDCVLIFVMRHMFNCIYFNLFLHEYVNYYIDIILYNYCIFIFDFIGLTITPVNFIGWKIRDTLCHWRHHSDVTAYVIDFYWSTIDCRAFVTVCSLNSLVIN